MVPVAFCIADLETIKQAALFYDVVVPFPLESLPDPVPQLSSTHEVMNNVWELIPLEFYTQLVGPIDDMVSAPDEYGAEGYKFQASFTLTLMLMYFFGALTTMHEEFTRDHVVANFPELNQYGLEPMIVMPEDTLRSNTAMIDDITVMLGNIPLIDTKGASWEHIMEVRRDDSSQKKLRNLRLFLQTNYAGKSRQFIEDDLAKRLDDYQTVVKEYGFETVMSVLTMITESKQLIAFGTASLAAMLLGDPAVATGSVITGVSVEIAKISLELVNKRHAFQKLKTEHELAYVMDFYERKVISDVLR